MKTSYSRPLIVSAFVLLGSVQAHASLCKYIEFAELQTLSASELQREMCLARITIAANRKIMDSPGMSQCLDQIIRIEKVMTKKKVKSTACKGADD
jgi:hypothetical protein